MPSASRILASRKGAHISWSRTDDPPARTEKARRAFLDRFEREADPDGVLPVEERARRAEHLRRAYFCDLALKSVRARQKKKAS